MLVIINEVDVIQFGQQRVGTPLSPPPAPNPPAFTDFVDYIFQFPDQGSFLRDPVIQQFAPQVLGSQPGVQLLIFNPVESLQGMRPTVGNTLVLPPQLAQSTVPLPGFWAMLTIQGGPNGLPILPLFNHPNIQVVNDRTLMFAGQPSVMLTKIDVSHINIIINIFGVYVRDGLRVIQYLALEAGMGQQPIVLEDQVTKVELQ